MTAGAASMRFISSVTKGSHASTEHSSVPQNQCATPGIAQTGG